MRHRFRWRALALAFLPAALVVATAAPAAAHEVRPVGQFKFTVGWGDEPPYAGFKNSVELIVHDAADKPVTDLGDTLKVEVSTGDQKMQVPIVPNFEIGEFGEPGDYRAWIIPTRPGTYTFHFTGTIKDQKVDESFTSSDKTFDDVTDPAEVEFPVKDPTVGQVADRLGNEVTRLDGATTTAASQAKKAKDSAGVAKVIGFAGLGVGVIALALGGVALARRRQQ